MTIKFGADMSYFLWSVGTGFIFAVIYDFIRVIRKVLNAPDLIVNLTDMLILIGCGFVATAEAYYINNGEIRIYSLFCMGLAFLMYRLIIENRLATNIEHLVKVIIKGISVCLQTILLPAKWLIKMFIKIIKKAICIKRNFLNKINVKNNE